MPLASGGEKTRWAITGVFLLYSVVVVTAPGVALPAAMFYPAAYMLYAHHATFRTLMAVSCAPLVLAVVPEFLPGSYLYAVLLVAAMNMHFFFRRRRFGLAVGVPALIVFGIVMASVFAVAHEGGTTFRQVILGWADAVVSESRRASAGMLSGRELQEFMDMLTVVRDRIVLLFPSIVLAGSAFALWLNMVFVASRWQGMVLGEWKSPEWLIAVFIIAGILVVLPEERLSSVGLNLLIVVGQAYFFQGLAIVAVFMNERGWPYLIRWPIYILILIQIYMMVMVAGLGLFDAWFDFRKRIRTSKGDRE